MVLTLLLNVKDEIIIIIIQFCMLFQNELQDVILYHYPPDKSSKHDRVSLLVGSMEYTLGKHGVERIVADCLPEDRPKPRKIKITADNANRVLEVVAGITPYLE